MKRIIITGALGQIGTELTVKLMEDYGEENVLPTDVHTNSDNKMITDRLEILDVRDFEKMDDLVRDFNPDTILIMAALLSATCEKEHLLACDINMNRLVNAITIARN